VRTSTLQIQAHRHYQVCEVAAKSGKWLDFCARRIGQVSISSRQDSRVELHSAGRLSAALHCDQHKVRMMKRRSGLALREKSDTPNQPIKEHLNSRFISINTKESYANLII
jgi:hypothetical protein